MRKILALLMLVAGVAASQAITVTLTPKTSFSGDGWLSPTEATWQTTTANTRGFAYNPSTGNLVVVTRTGSATQVMRVLDGQTGAEVGQLNQGTGVLSGGTFVVNMAGIADDGAIYIANLSGSNFKVYRWANEAATPTVAFVGNSGLTRVGDSFDVIGSGMGTRMITGGTGSNGYAVLNTTDGLNYNMNTFTRPDDNVRLGITFGATDSLFYGRETSSAMVRGSFTLGPNSSTDLGTAALTSNGEAPMDFAVVNNVPLLAVADVNNSVVRVYDMTNPATPVLMASLTTTSGTLASNANAVGQVKWGAISGENATLYAMSSNQGIQSFNVQVVPEPGTMAALGLGLAAILRRRAKKS